MKKTKWFMGYVKPVRVGLYERTILIDNTQGSTRYSYWNGESWQIGKVNSVWQPYFDEGFDFKWRGLVKP